MLNISGLVIFKKSLQTLFLVSLFLLRCPAVVAADGVDYFKPLEERQMVEALKSVKVETCEQLFQKYFEIEDSNPMVQGIAYEYGLCVQQDLEKAKDFYEKSFKSVPLFPIIPLRLALIYEFGPDTLKNPDRADFFMKQSAIFLAGFSDGKTRYQVLSALLEGLPVPDSMQKHMNWLEKILHKSTVEKKKIATELQIEGFEDTDLIWDPIDYIKLTDP